VVYGLSNGERLKAESLGEGREWRSSFKPEYGNGGDFEPRCRPHDQ